MDGADEVEREEEHNLDELQWESGCCPRSTSATRKYFPLPPGNNLFEAIIINTHRTHGFFLIRKKEVGTIYYFRNIPRGTPQKWGQMRSTFLNTWSLSDTEAYRNPADTEVTRHIYVYEYCIYCILNAIHVNLVLRVILVNWESWIPCHQFLLNGTLPLVIHRG